MLYQLSHHARCKLTASNNSEMVSFCAGSSQGSSLKRECVATDVDILHVLLSAWENVEHADCLYIHKYCRRMITSHVISNAGTPRQRGTEWGLWIVPMGPVDCPHGACGLPPHCWHGLAVSLYPSLSPSHALALAVLFFCPNIPCLSCHHLCGSSELLTWHCLS